MVRGRARGIWRGGGLRLKRGIPGSGPWKTLFVRLEIGNGRTKVPFTVASTSGIKGQCHFRDGVDAWRGTSHAYTDTSSAAYDSRSRGREIVVLSSIGQWTNSLCSR